MGVSIGIGTAAPASGGQAPSHIQRNTGTSRGSANTTILRHTNEVSSSGSDMTYVDSSTLGGSVTINTAGVYAVYINHRANAAVAIRKDTALDNTFDNTSETNLYASAGASNYSNLTAIINCAANDKIWFSATANGSIATQSCFTIVGPLGGYSA